jgi:tetratricopeptide (TPR) repeat protein
MSPEQAAGEDVDRRSDVFSLGVVFYELLTGRLPFRGDHEAAVIYSIMNTDPEPLATHRGDIPEDAQRVIDKALAKERDDRYASASDLLADLKRLQEGRHVAALEKRATKKVGRRAVIYAALAIVVIVAGYAAITRLVPGDGTTPQEPTVSPTAVAVLPFAVRGNDEFADMSEGMVDLLSTKLDGAGTLRSVDARSLLSFVRRQGDGAPDPELGRLVAEEFGAGLYLLGDIMAVGERLHVNASLYESGGESEPVAEATVEGEAIQMLDMVDDLATQLLKGRLGGTGEFRYDLSTITTKSYPALKAYLLGEASVRGTEPQIQTAIEAHQRAVDEDSTFALAWYGLAKVWFRFGADYSQLDMIREFADRAESLSAGLPHLDRLRIQALRANVYQNDDDAEQLYRTIVSNAPEDFESWLALGTLQQQCAYRRGRSPSESREALERAYSLDPQDWRILLQMNWLSAFEKDYAFLGKMSGMPEFRLANRAILAFDLGTRAEQDTVLMQLSAWDDLMLATFGGVILTYTNDFVRSKDVARLLTEPKRPNEVQGQGHVLIAYLEAARGRWRAAKEELKAAEALNPVLTIEYGSLLSAAPFLPISEAELRSVRDEIDGWDAASVPPSASPSLWLSYHDRMHPHLRAYLLGIVSARLGDHDRALACTQEMEKLSGPSQVTDLMRDMACGIRAQVHWNQGDNAAALAEFEKMKMPFSTDFRLWSPFFQQWHERYMRAELLHEMGRDEEALGWTSSFPDINGIGFLYRAPIHLRRAEYYERTGRTAEAAENYAAFIEIWKDCDEELRPIVDEARSRLNALAAEKG